jgi:hypothetical protein
VWPLLNTTEKFTTLARPIFEPILDWVWANAAEVSDHCLAGFSLFNNRIRHNGSVFESLDLGEERKQRIAAEIREITKRKEKPIVILEDAKREFVFIPSQEPSVRFHFAHDRLTDQELIEQIKASIENVRDDHFFLAVKYMVKNNLSLDILNQFDVSEIGFGDVLPLLRGSFDRSAVMKCETVNQLIGVLKFKETIGSFHVMDHAKKKDIQSVLCILPLIDTVEIPDLVNACLTCLHTADIKIVIPLIGATIEKLPEIPKQLVSSILGLFEETFAELPIDAAAILLLKIVSRYTNQNIRELVIRLNALPRSRLFEALIIANVTVQDDQLHAIISNLLASLAPSSSRCALQLIDRILSLLPSADLLRPHLPDMLERLELFHDIHPVVEVAQGVLKKVVETGIQPIKSLDSFIGSPAAAQFPYYEQFFVALLKETDPNSAVWRQVAQVTDRLCDFPPLFQMFLACLSARLACDPQPSVMVDGLLRWCEKCTGCYSLSEQICQWARVLIPVCGADETLSHLCFTIPKHIPQFSQYFSGLVRALSENDYPGAADSLENAALLQTDPARAEALRVAAMSRDYAKALAIAIHSERV